MDKRHDTRPASSTAAPLLKVDDPDAYVSTLVLPRAFQAPVQAILAFAATVARTRDRVSEPAPGEIRLRYWLDLLGGDEHGITGANPLAVELLATIDRYDLPTGPLRRLLAARRFDLYDDPMPDMATFEGYAGETVSILYQLSSVILNGGNDAGAADAAGHLGVAHALIENLRALPRTASRGQICLPWKTFQDRGATPADYLGGKATPATIAACGDLRRAAATHLGKARTAIAALPENVRPAFARIAILQAQLKRLEMHANLPFLPPHDSTSWQKIALLVWWSVRN
ncbi:MAG TPA: phytoene/squalene synthase family protein [Devosia sp.]|nr:phytoene/squalene synthase family protein [Devosia sp.]